MDAIVMSASDSVSDLTAASAYGNVRTGDNGYVYGVPVADIWSGSSGAGGIETWDSNLSDGFDSGTNAAIFDFKASSSVARVAGLAGPLTTAGLGGAVSQVIVRSDVQSVNSEAKWADIVVRFFKAGVLRQTINVGTLDAKTTDDWAQEKMAVVTPTATDNDEVIITGTVRLISTDADSSPDASQMFCQALIYT